MSGFSGEFRFRERQTSLRTELAAGATTYLTMVYIVAVNPAILTDAGMPRAGVAAATCLSAGVASLLMGLIADAPLALAPGMGLNAYFSYTVVQQMHIPWPVGLGCVLLSGVAFLVLTLAGVRRALLACLPPHLLAAIAGGIGLFIGFIGLKTAGVIVASPATGVTLGSLRAPGPIIALAGLAIMAVLSARRMKGAVLAGIIAATALAAALGQVVLRPQPLALAAIGETAFKLDVAGVFASPGRTAAGLLEVLLVFLFVDLFDNLGALAAVTRRAGLMRPDGTIPRLDRMLLTDSLATIVGALAGTTTVTTYVESAAGVQAGGRTGLTAITVGVLFLATLFLAPYAALIPAAATAPALILVGALMMAPLAEVDWIDPAKAIPAFLTLAAIPLSFSIATGLAFGIIAEAVMRLTRGELTRADAPLLILAALCASRFALLAGG